MKHKERERAGRWVRAIRKTLECKEREEEVKENAIGSREGGGAGLIIEYVRQILKSASDQWGEGGGG